MSPWRNASLPLTCSTSFGVTRCMLNFLLKISWHAQIANSLTVNRRFARRRLLIVKLINWSRRPSWYSIVQDRFDDHFWEVREHLQQLIETFAWKFPKFNVKFYAASLFQKIAHKKNLNSNTNSTKTVRDINITRL